MCVREIERDTYMVGEWEEQEGEHTHAEVRGRPHKPNSDHQAFVASTITHWAILLAPGLNFLTYLIERETQIYVYENVITKSITFYANLEKRGGDQISCG